MVEAKTVAQPLALGLGEQHHQQRDGREYRPDFIDALGAPQHLDQGIGPRIHGIGRQDQQHAAVDHLRAPHCRTASRGTQASMAGDPDPEAKARLSLLAPRWRVHRQRCPPTGVRRRIAWRPTGGRRTWPSARRLGRSGRGRMADSSARRHGRRPPTGRSPPGGSRSCRPTGPRAHTSPCPTPCR